MSAAAERDILVLTSSYPRFRGDFAGVFVSESCAYLAGRERVTVLAPGDVLLDDSYSECGVTIHRFPTVQVPFQSLSPFYGAGGPENLERLGARLAAPLSLTPMAAYAAYHARKKTHIVAHWLLPSGLIACAFLRPGQHLTLISHGGGWHMMKRLPFGLQTARLILRRCDDVVCVAGYLRKEMLELFKGEERQRMEAKIRVVPMGLHGAMYAVPEREFAKERPLRILSVGRLVPIKGLDRLLRALVGLRATLWVVGDGPEFERLTELGRSLGVHVKFFGALPHARLRDLYAHADAFAFTSTPVNGRVEGMPRVVLEAMSAGLPIVASVTGGVGECLRHEGNALLDEQDDAMLRANLARLLDDAALRERLSLAAKESARAYDWREVGPRLFAGVLGRPGAASCGAEPMCATRTGEEP